jgi:hypothetical protein
VDFANQLDLAKSAPHDVFNRSETTAQTQQNEGLRSPGSLRECRNELNGEVQVRNMIARRKTVIVRRKRSSPGRKIGWKV